MNTIDLSAREIEALELATEFVEKNLAERYEACKQQWIDGAYDDLLNNGRTVIRGFYTHNGREAVLEVAQ